MLNVVVIEDNEVDAAAIRRSSAQIAISHVLREARNAEQAFELLHSGAVPLNDAVVVVDIGLPGLSGLQLLAKIREDEKLHSVPVVVLTDSMKPEDLQESQRLNASGYFQKPKDPSKLTFLLETIVTYWSAGAMPP